MATNTSAPTTATGAKSFIRLKEAALKMEVSYMWLYKQVVEKKAIPYKKRGASILIPLDKFVPWSQQDIIP